VEQEVFHPACEVHWSMRVGGHGLDGEIRQAPCLGIQGLCLIGSSVSYDPGVGFALDCHGRVSGVGASQSRHSIRAMLACVTDGGVEWGRRMATSDAGRVHGRASYPEIGCSTV
jgi:hypothetical protein